MLPRCGPSSKLPAGSGCLGAASADRDVQRDERDVQSCMIQYNQYDTTYITVGYSTCSAEYSIAADDV